MFEFEEYTIPILTVLSQLEMEDLVLVDADIASSPTMPAERLGAALPHIMHLPVGGTVKFETVDGGPSDTGGATAPIQERTTNLKIRILLFPALAAIETPGEVYTEIAKWEDIYPTFAAYHRMLVKDSVAHCQRFQVAEKQEGQRWAFLVFTFKGEEFVGVEFDASITYDVNVKTKP